MDFETLELNVSNKVATVTLNRPSLNPLNKKLFEELYNLLEYIEHNDEIRAVIITGKGERAFAAGADIHEMAQLDAVGVSQMGLVSRRCFDRIERLGKPVIAAINGLALGGGCELALCCDFRICADNAKFALPEINLAIIPGGGGTQRLQRLIGQSRAKELLYFGDMIGAQDAYAFGLVNRIVPLEELMKVSNEWASKLADKPAVAMRMMKTAVYAGANTTIDNALFIEAACFGNTFTTKDREEGMNSFVEKRKPNYVGK